MECCYIWVSEDYDVLGRNLKEVELCMSNTFLLFLCPGFHSPQDTPFEDGKLTQRRINSLWCTVVFIFPWVVIKEAMFLRGTYFVFVPTGTFKLQMEFTEEYPNKPPTVRFLSRMFHPNGKLSHWFLLRVICSSFYRFVLRFLQVSSSQSRKLR